MSGLEAQVRFHFRGNLSLRLDGEVMKRLTRDKHVYVLAPEAQPAVTVSDGEDLLVETWDAFEGERDVKVLASRPPQGPATGPIAVSRARPGDTLRVDILDIKVVGDAVHWSSPGRGFLPQRFDEHYVTRYRVDGDDLVSEKGIRVPLRPSVGLIATTPRRARSTASDSGPYGGDLDLPELTAGSSIFLPVLVPGALLALGDCHAAVGDGAVGGTGAECGAEVRLRLSLEKGKKIPGPRALTPEYFVTIAPGANLGRAMRRAVREMVDYLVEEKGMEAYEAYGLLSVAGDIRVCRTFRPISPVKMLLSRRVLEQLG